MCVCSCERTLFSFVCVRVVFVCCVVCTFFWRVPRTTVCVCARAGDMCSRGFCFFPVCSHSRSLLVCVLCVSMRVRAFFVCLFSCVFARRMYVCCVCVGEGVFVCV